MFMPGKYTGSYLQQKKHEAVLLTRFIGQETVSPEEIKVCETIGHLIRTIAYGIYVI